MAKLTANALLTPHNIEVGVGTVVEVLKATDNSFKWMSVVWRPRKDKISGNISTALLQFSAEELALLDVPLDSDDLPLFRDLRVRYVGPTKDALTDGETLVGQDLWYEMDKLECRCIQIQGMPNTNARVIVKCNLLKRV